MTTWVDLEDPWEAIEVCYARGWTHGLPAVPPTEALVERMLGAGPWPREHVLLYGPVRDLAVTAEKPAINAVMAGCHCNPWPFASIAVRRTVRLSGRRRAGPLSLLFGGHSASGYLVTSVASAPRRVASAR